MPNFTKYPHCDKKKQIGYLLFQELKVRDWRWMIDSFSWIFFSIKRNILERCSWFLMFKEIYQLKTTFLCDEVQIHDVLVQKKCLPWNILHPELFLLVGLVSAVGLMVIDSYRCHQLVWLTCSLTVCCDWWIGWWVGVCGGHWL